MISYKYLGQEVSKVPPQQKLTHPNEKFWDMFLTPFASIMCTLGVDLLNATISNLLTILHKMHRHCLFSWLLCKIVWFDQSRAHKLSDLKRGRRRRFGMRRCRLAYVHSKHNETRGNMRRCRLAYVQSDEKHKGAPLSFEAPGMGANLSWCGN